MVFFQGQVRGAPAIAIVGCLSLAVELTTGQQFESAAALLAHVRRRLAHLVTSRPTAVNLQKAASALLLLAERTERDGADVTALRDRSVGTSGWRCLLGLLRFRPVMAAEGRCID